MDPVPGIDVCICTYNRVALLQQCIEPLVPQMSNYPVTITIVDNNSTDDTRAYVKSIAENIPGIRYLCEETQGLSYARNRAWLESNREWILYLDDDCIPDSDTLSTAFLSILNHPEADAIGGPIDPAFSETPPSWLPEGFGEFKLPFEKFSIIQKGYIRGVCFLIKRSVLEELRGFDIRLGVKGSLLRYGEEFELQIRMRKEGLKIAYDPALRVRHQVRLEKINPHWIIRSEYARRRDRMKFAPIKKKDATLNLIRTACGRILWSPLHLGKAIFKKNYSWKSACLDIARPLAYRWGEFIGVWLRKNK